MQFARPTCASAQNLNRPFYIAPGNRVDLLVQAPLTPGTFNVLIQPVMARSQIKPTPVHSNANDPAPGTVLMTVDVFGDPVTLNRQPVRTYAQPRGKTLVAAMRSAAACTALNAAPRWRTGSQETPRRWSNISAGSAGYATEIGYFAHAVGETNEDLKALIGAAPTIAGPGFLLPTRNHDLFSWCL